MRKPFEGDVNPSATQRGQEDSSLIGPSFVYLRLAFIVEVGLLADIEEDRDDPVYSFTFYASRSLCVVVYSK